MTSGCSQSGLVALVGLLCFGCTADERVQVGPNPSAEPSPTVGALGEPVGVRVGPGATVDLEPEPEAPKMPFRHRRRMDIDQLDATIRSVTGGIGWTELRSGREVNLFEELAQTLGKPDYLQITDEDLQPSAMFQKFLDDAARSVCFALMDEEARRAPPERVFFVRAEPTDTLASSPEATMANLQHLLLRFHGRKLAEDAPELEPWRWLVESAAHVTPDPVEVWRTVCVGLMTHPDFFTY